MVCFATVEEELCTDAVAAAARLDFFVATKGFSVACWHCLSDSLSSAFFSPSSSSSSFMVDSGGEAAAALLEAKDSALARAFSALVPSAAALTGFKRENLEMRSVLPTALVTLSSVVLIRDMRVLAHSESVNLAKG